MANETSTSHTATGRAGSLLNKLALSKADGDQAGATRRIKDLETAWDKAQSRLQRLDKPAWNVLDGEIDTVLSTLRASHPDQAKEQQALAYLRMSLER